MEKPPAILAEKFLYPSGLFCVALSLVLNFSDIQPEVKKEFVNLLTVSGIAGLITGYAVEKSNSEIEKHLEKSKSFDFGELSTNEHVVINLGKQHNTIDKTLSTELLFNPNLDKDFYTRYTNSIFNFVKSLGLSQSAHFICASRLIDKNDDNDVVTLSFFELYRNPTGVYSMYKLLTENNFYLKIKENIDEDEMISALIQNPFPTIHIMSFAQNTTEGKIINYQSAKEVSLDDIVRYEKEN